MHTKEKIYRKAYVELNEILKILSENELSKIPDGFIKNLKNEMDKEYIWKYDNTKGILEQNLMTETKALLVDIYIRFLCPEEKKKVWKKYDEICLENIEQIKSKKYSSNNLFNAKQEKTEETEKTNELVKYKKKSIFEKIFDKIKNIFNR